MDFSDHLAVSAPLGAAVALASGDVLAGSACFLAGVFIDLDHFVDYWRETGFNADIPRFMGYFDGGHAKHLVLPLHAWEWCLSVALLAGILHWPGWVWGACVGWFCHLLLDQRYNKLHPWSYSFFYRLKVGFNARPMMDWKP